jgi:hypothetical protein
MPKFQNYNIERKKNFKQSTRYKQASQKIYVLEVYVIFILRYITMYH